jgi:integrase
MISDTICKNAKPKKKPYKLSDEKGLFLLVNPNGSKYFRLKYRFGGQEKTLALGVYPETSLKSARIKREEARELIAKDIDPAENKKAVKQAKAESAANSFEVIALEWLVKKCNDKSSRPKRLLGYVIPWIGSKPITDIIPKDILLCLRRVEEGGAGYSAKKALQMYGQVFRYAVATGRTDRDITQDLKGALAPNKVKHFASITEPKEVSGLLRAIDGYQGSFVVKCSLQFAPLVFVRPGELRVAEWNHFDLDAKEWRYFVTKTEVQHIVPLSRQVIEILKELQPLTGHGRYVFPSERTPRGDRCMSENTLNGALKRLGYGKDEMTAHGFRAMARTILDEVLGFRPDFIEHQLAHAVRDPNGRAYNRTAHLAERKKMMQAWADYLDSLKNGAEVIPFRRQI